MTIDAQGPSGAGQLGPIPYLRLPDPEQLFARRAQRFEALAPGHTLGEYLEFLARIAKAQLTAWETVTVRPERRPARPESKDEPNPRGWHEILRVIVTELSTRRAIPSESREALERLASAPPEALDAIAARVLANAAEGSDLATGPFVAAALQVDRADRAATVDASSVARPVSGCPVCGALPVVGVVLGDDRLRYLVCSVCATQWHHTRVQCTACQSGKDIAYYQLEGDRASRIASAGAAKAEACPSCRAYTKLFYLEKDPAIEPFADDVATLALDLLMAESGWVRHGVNLFLMPPEAEPERPGSRSS